jgi:2-desacetyl-2-hydroxyethyl bacteriochlorophyllide A dehydrogenase
MRACVLRKGKLIVDTIPDPAPGDGQVLVRPLACGICGSDLHAARHVSELAQIMVDVGDPFPIDPDRDMVMGHEFCAEVVDFGPHTERKLRPGTRVCSLPLLFCQGQRHTLTYSTSFPGAFSERMVLCEDLLLPVPDDLPTPAAAWTEPLAVSLHAVEKARLGPGDIPVVIGGGPVGLLIIACLKERGIETILAADFSPTRRRHALAMGAVEVSDPRQQPAMDMWRKHARRKQRAVIFECVGVPGLLDQLIRQAPPKTRLIVAGVCMRSDAITPALAVIKELEAQFVFGYTPQEFSQSLQMLAEGRIRVDGLVTGMVGLDGVAGAFASLENPEQHVKILVEPWR